MSNEFKTKHTLFHALLIAALLASLGVACDPGEGTHDAGEWPSGVEGSDIVSNDSANVCFGGTCDIEEPDGCASPPCWDSPPEPPTTPLPGSGWLDITENDPLLIPPCSLTCDQANVAPGEVYEEWTCAEYVCEDDDCVRLRPKSTGSPCEVTHLCLNACQNGEVAPGCGQCQPVGEDGEMQCVPVHEFDLMEEDQDGCHDPDPCLERSCILHRNGKYGCEDDVSLISDGTACDDNDPLTFETGCYNGLCQCGPGDTLSCQIDCEDGNPCTEDYVAVITVDGEEVAKCEHICLDDIPCDDDQICTLNDRCLDCQCVGDPDSCDNGNPCTKGVCNEQGGGCQQEIKQDGTTCPPPDACFDEGSCSSGVCVPDPASLNTACDPESPCDLAVPVSADGACTCTHEIAPDMCLVPGAGDAEATCIPEGTTEGCWTCSDGGQSATFLSNISCDDGDACTYGDSCSMKGGVPGCWGLDAITPPNWSAQAFGQCTDLVCDGGPFMHMTVAAGWCLVGEACVAAGDAIPDATCTLCAAQGDGLPGKSAPAPNGTPCDSGYACVFNETCTNGTCGGGIDVNCPVPGPCALPNCLPDGTCGVPTRIALDACLLETSSGWACFAPGDVNPDNPCQQCYPALNKWTPKSIGVPCNDGDCCTTSDFCDGSGQCLGIPVDCTGGNPCLMGVCLPGSCVDSIIPACMTQPVPNSPPVPCETPCGTTGICHEGTCASNPLCQCFDDNPCTVDLSDGLTCSFLPVNVDDGDPCTVDSCDEASGAIIHIPVDVVDGNACTVDTCDPETGELIHTPMSFDDGDPCTIDDCDPVTGEFHDPAPGMPCDDGNLCTTEDLCDAQGVCIGDTPIVCEQPDDPCWASICISSSGLCEATPASGGSKCIDENPDTVADHCDGGLCVGTPGSAGKALVFDGTTRVEFGPFGFGGPDYTVVTTLRWDPVPQWGFFRFLELRAMDGSATLTLFRAGAAEDGAPWPDEASPGQVVLLAEVDGVQSWWLVPGGGLPAQGEWLTMAVVVTSGSPALLLTNSGLSPMVPSSNNPGSLALPDGQYELLAGDGDTTTGDGAFLGTMTKLSLWGHTLPIGSPSYLPPNLTCEWKLPDADPPSAYGVQPVVYSRMVLLDDGSVDNDGTAGNGKAGLEPGADNADPTQIPSTDEFFGIIPENCSP